MSEFSVITAAAVNGLPAAAECLRALERRRGNLAPEKLSSLRLRIPRPDSGEIKFLRVKPTGLAKRRGVFQVRAIYLVRGKARLK